mgnify:CR=1 FL=1
MLPPGEQLRLMSLRDLRCLLDACGPEDCYRLAQILKDDPRRGAAVLAQRAFARYRHQRQLWARWEAGFYHERKWWEQGKLLVAGVDEAGRGPLAGPVVAAAVILPRDVVLLGLDDSKTLSPAQRTRLYRRIMRCAVSVGVGIVPARRIDTVRIHVACMEAMREAVARLMPTPDVVIVDGPWAPQLRCPVVALRGGDRRSNSVRAASVVAKVLRDRLMERLHRRYPQYGFDRNKGYGTPEHRQALQRFGPCPIHRLSFVKRWGSCHYSDPHVAPGER